jgi:hypothetical protein
MSVFTGSRRCVPSLHIINRFSSSSIHVNCALHLRSLPNCYYYSPVVFSLLSLAMTFLSHSLPWLSLSRLFEYRAAKSGPGPQEPDLRGREGPAHRKQLEHFAKQFQDVVREHALIERGKYSTARAYHQRATSWTVSSLKELPELVHDARSSNVEPERRDGNSPMGSSTSAWTTVPSTEERRVYPAYFSDTYMSLVSPTSGGPWGRLGLLASLADISTWIDHCAQDWVSSDEESRNQVWLDNKSCSDVLRLLVIDAATTSDESRRTKNLSTLLLITNHPGVGLSDFLGGGMSCCNLSTGLAALVDKTVMVFIYLNLLLALADDDVDGKLLSLCDSLEQFKLIRGLGTLVRLLPRPAYMNTKSFALLIDEVLYEHGHAVEHILFNPLFAPRPSGCRSKWLRSDGDPDPDTGKTGKKGSSGTS